MHLALIAPPTPTVDPSSLGGLNLIRWLADGLADRGHQVTLIGAGLDRLELDAPTSYALVDTDPTGEARGLADDVDRFHAELAGKALEGLDGVDLVSDHTRTGYLPTPRPRLLTAWTVYSPAAGPHAPERLSRLPGHIGMVAVSGHQQRSALGLPWLDVIHPAIPIGEHQPSLDHNGPCLYLGPLLRSHGAREALEAAHAAGRPIVLANTQPCSETWVYGEIQLRPHLTHDDQLLEHVSPSQRWGLLSAACCLVAPLRYDTPWSLEITEALACGTPVVTMQGTVGAEQVTHAVCGLVVADIDHLPAAIMRVGRLDPKEIREHAAARFDVGGMVAAYEAMFQRVVRR